MKRFLGPFQLAIVSFSLCLFAASARGDQPSSSSPATPWSGSRGLRRLEECLSKIDLSPDQQTAVQSILSSIRTARQADVQALRADRQKLHDDIANGADKSALGQDVLNQEADATKLRDDLQAARDQILSKLTADQQNTIAACAPPRSGKSR